MARRGRRKGEGASELASGIGADVRHSSLSTRAGTSAGWTTPTPRTDAVMVVANEGLDWSEFLGSDDAQQASACACVRTRSDASGANRLCAWGIRRRQRSRPCALQGLAATLRRLRHSRGHRESERESRETLDEPQHRSRMLDQRGRVKRTFRYFDDRSEGTGRCHRPDVRAPLPGALRVSSWDLMHDHARRCA